jgi:ligand-binding sensor domain-containing protein
MVLILAISGCRPDDPTYPNWKVYDRSNSDIPSDTVYTLIVDENDAVWMNSGNIGFISKFGGENWYNTMIPGTDTFPHDWVSEIAVSPLNTIWMFHTSGRLLELVNGQWIVHADNSPFGIVQSMEFSGSGELWAATSQGLATYVGASWSVFNTSNSGIAASELFGLLLDSDGTVWCSSVGNPLGDPTGLIHYDFSEWNFYTADNSQLTANWIPFMELDNAGVKWFVANDGIVSVQGTEWFSFDFEGTALETKAIRAFVIDQHGGKWFGTDKGLVYWKEYVWGVFNQNNSGLPSDQVNDVALDGTGNIYIATDRGLAIFNRLNSTACNVSSHI